MFPESLLSKKEPRRRRNPSNSGQKAFGVLFSIRKNSIGTLTSPIMHVILIQNNSPSKDSDGHIWRGVGGGFSLFFFFLTTFSCLSRELSIRTLSVTFYSLRDKVSTWDVSIGIPGNVQVGLTRDKWLRKCLLPFVLLSTLISGFYWSLTNTYY